MGSSSNDEYHSHHETSFWSPESQRAAYIILKIPGQGQQVVASFSYNKLVCASMQPCTEQQSSGGGMDASKAFKQPSRDAAGSSTTCSDEGCMQKYEQDSGCDATTQVSPLFCSLILAFNCLINYSSLFRFRFVS